MSNIIQDGKGGGFFAGVSQNNRLMTTGVDLSLTEAATETGDTYNINTSIMSLVSSSKHALLYLQNNEDRNLIIDTTIINIKDFSGTPGQPILTIHRNPISGDIIDSGTACEETNRNYGENKTLNVTCKTGGEGFAFSGGQEVTVFLPSVSALTFNTFSTLVVLPRGASIGISYTPPTGVTSVDVIAAFNVTLNGEQL